MKKKKQVFREASLIAVCAMLLLLCGGAIPVNRQPIMAVRYPVETGTVLHNPYTGFAADARDPEAVLQPVTLVHANLKWRELEPEAGKYNFEGIEQTFHFQYWREKGVRVVLRVVLDDPGEDSHLDIPDWLYQEIGEKGTWYDLQYGKGFSPDYSNPLLIASHQKLIEALAQRYNNDPFVAFIQLGSIGHWGEWHTMDSGPGRIPFPPRSVTDRYIEPYVQFFSGKPLLMRRPTEAAARYRMGLYNDAFGKHDATIDGFLNWFSNGYTSWLTLDKEPAMRNFWVNSPSGGEFSDPRAYLQDETLEESLKQAKLTHVSWLGPSAPWDEEPGGPLQANIDRFLRTIGYRFVIQKAVYEEKRKPGETLHVKLIVANRGTAPFYFKWPLEISLADDEGNIRASVRSSTDIRSWLPGASSAVVHLNLPGGLPSGRYTVLAAILDPASGLPGVDFAISGRRQDGRFPLGSVTIANR
ncbi:Beta-galactosidase [Paenibacillus sophorae]|uniref:Beta-galactosidase n=1 Tax=Paenibacillus sophorae TaxID=1333845 RepID=A0A1H8FV38_9BACL|nr:DUF4832 domain-containing protein [Paenibacillus sophorae]QWU13991.1 DUF4832 domain-containing protein [Paenibacillus sophorae]SEN35509.1 Beta-galactosidase [Paenibacillus sophorae]